MFVVSWKEAADDSGLGYIYIYQVDLQTSFKKRCLSKFINLPWNIIWMSFHPVKEIGKWVHVSLWFELSLQYCISYTHPGVAFLLMKIID